MTKVLAVLVCALLIVSCSSKEKKWGKEFDLEGKWWEQNGQSYDPNTKIFMAVGTSRGNLGQERLERDSADMDARKQAANFMQSMVSSYVKECSSNGVDSAENMVKAISEEILVGSAIVDRHYDQQKKVYHSLMKVNLNYFFEKAKEKVQEATDKTIREKYKDLDPDLRARETKNELATLNDRITKVESSVSEGAEKLNAPKKDLPKAQ